MKLFWEAVLPALLAIVGAGASWALARLAQHLQAQAAKSRWALASAQLAEIARMAVAEAEVTLRPQFARAMSDGKLSAEEGAALKGEVARIVKEKLAPETLRALEKGLGDLLGWHLGGAIERAVVEDKLDRAAQSRP
jgi:hypothetical protein